MSEAKPILNSAALQEPLMIEVGRHLAPLLHAGDVIALHGALGAGKTTLARTIIRTALNEDVDVASPTFTLMQEYPFKTTDGKSAIILHCDLYRLESESEVHAIGLLDMLEHHITIIEWPEIIESLLPPDTLHIHLMPDGDDNSRRLTFFGVGDWEVRLKPLKPFMRA